MGSSGSGVRNACFLKPVRLHVQTALTIEVPVAYEALFLSHFGITMMKSSPRTAENRFYQYGPRNHSDIACNNVNYTYSILHLKVVKIRKETQVFSQV